MDHVNYKRLFVEEEIVFDESKFFTDIDAAIEYLKTLKKEHPNKKLILDDKWTGYEDRYTRLFFKRLENDREYECRIETEEDKEKYRLERQSKKEKDELYNRRLKEIKAEIYGE